MSPGPPEDGGFRNRNYPEPAPVDPETRLAELGRRVERLENLVESLDRRRARDEPAIEHAEWDRRRYEFGTVAGAILLVVGAVVYLLTR